MEKTITLTSGEISNITNALYDIRQSNEPFTGSPHLWC